MLKIDKTRLLGYRQGVSVSEVPMVGVKSLSTRLSDYPSLIARKGIRVMVGVKPRG